VGHGDSESALDDTQRQLHGLDQIAVVEIIDQVGQDFGIGLGFELVALVGQLDLQGGMVFDDTVVDQGDLPRHVGMGIDLVGRPVGRPTGVTDPAGSLEGIPVKGRFQIDYLALLLDHVLTAGGHDGQTRAVVPPIFQPFEAFEQDRGRVRGSHHSNYSAHRLFLHNSDALRRI